MMTTLTIARIVAKTNIPDVFMPLDYAKKGTELFLALRASCSAQETVRKTNAVLITSPSDAVTASVYSPGVNLLLTPTFS